MEQSRDQFLAHADARHENAEVLALGGTGVCDWHPQLDEILARRPGALVLSFAGNDLTTCMLRTPTPSTPSQTATEYATDIGELVGRFRSLSPGTHVYLVMPPPVAKPQFEANAAAMRRMYKRFAADHPEVTLVDVTGELAPDQRFHAALPCQSWERAACGPDGTIELRRSDGIHLTPAGGERYARALMAALGQG
jgi:lysophospholipase L1-like esterase